MATSADFFSAVGNNINNDNGPLPQDVIARLRELETEFLDGDITEKGYLKRRQRIIEAARGPSLLFVDCDTRQQQHQQEEVVVVSAAKQQKTADESEELSSTSNDEDDDDLLDVDKEGDDNGLKNDTSDTANGGGRAYNTNTITISCSKLKKKDLMLATATQSTSAIISNTDPTTSTIMLADEDVDLDEICQQYLDHNNNNNIENIKANNPEQQQQQQASGTLEDNHFQSDIRTEAVIEALTNFSEDNHHFRANLHPSVVAASGRSGRARASSVSLSSKAIAESIHCRYNRRRKSISSAHQTSSSEKTTAPVENRQHQPKASSVGPTSSVPETTPPQSAMPAAVLQPKRTTSSASSTSPSNNSASLPLSTSSNSSGTGNGTRLIRRVDENGVMVEQVPDIILDLRDLDDRNHQNGTNNHHDYPTGGNNSSLGSGSRGSTDLQQLILSNFNSGTASLGHKRNKKGKNKNKFRAQQVLYLAGRGTHASELTRATSGGLFAETPNMQPAFQHQISQPEVPQFRGRVSTKIEQLARTLRRPKPRPLQDYFQDDSEIMFTDASKQCRSPTTTNQNNNPEPSMTPIVTEPLKLMSGLPLNPLFALFRYGSSASYRSQAISVVEPRTGKISQTVFYHKLLENSLKLAYALSHAKKIFQLMPCSDQNGRIPLEPPKPGARVVLAYPMGDAISFATAFYACLLAGLVPVPIDPPTNTRREAFCQSIGIFVGAVGAQLVLTSFDAFRGLAKDPQTGGVSPIKCWPNVTWLMFDQTLANSLAKPSKNWKPHVSPEANNTSLESQLAFIQYSITRDGDVLPVSLTYDCVTKHIQSLAAALGVVEGQLVVNLLDIKRDFGIWFSLLASVYYGMHVILVSFAQVKADPLLWLRIVTKHKPPVVLTRSRDLYWTVMSHRAEKAENKSDLKFDLSSIKQLIISDAANSWTVSPCESFVSQFASSGFKVDAVTPIAFSPECLTVSVRRPGHVIGDARLSLDQLSINQVQIDCSTLRCLAIQDCGTPLPASTLAVVKLNANAGAPDLGSNSVDLAKPDEIGEICMARHQQWSPSYFDLAGQTSMTFKLQLNQPKPQQPAVNPEMASLPPSSLSQQAPVYFTRSGLFGFVSPAGSVFVVGSRELSIFTNGRRYSADDLSATILAVEPQNFVYRARLCVVPVKLARDERIVAVVEQNCNDHPTDSAAFAWMAKVIQAIDTLHNVSLYSLAVVQPGRLPRTPQGFINRHAVRRLFEDGHLHPTNILLCPHSAITNLPQPRLTPAAVHPSAQLLSNLLHGQRLAVAQGPQVVSPSSLMAKSESFDSQSAMVYNNGLNTVSSCTSQGSRLTSTPTPTQNIANHEVNQASLAERLKILAQRDPDRVLYSFVNQKGLVEHELTALQLHRRAERVACQLLEKARVQTGDRVVILLPAPSGDFLASIYGALYVGCVPMVVRSPMVENLPATLSSCVLTIQICKPVCLICTPQMARFFKSKEAAKMLLPPKNGASSAGNRLRKLPKIIAVDGSRSASSSKRLANVFRPNSLDVTMYIDLVVSSTGSLTGVRVSHASALALCRSVKMQAELYPSRDILLAGLDPLSGLGFALFALVSVYAGHKTLVASLNEIEADPFGWLRSASLLQIRDVFVSPATLELCVRGFFQNPAAPPFKCEDEHRVCLTNVRSCIVISEERPHSALISQFVKAFQSYGLQRRCVTAAFGCRMNVSMCLQPSNAPEPEQVHIDTKSLRNDRLAIVERGSPYAVCLTACGRVLPGVRAVIANPETRAQLGEEHLGEIWVASPHNTNGFYTIGGVTEGDPDADTLLEPFDTRFASRLETGDTNTVYARTGFLGFIRSGSLFVVGPIEQSIFVNNQRYQPCDLESTLLKLDPRRIPECAVFLASNLLVAVIEFDGPEAWALDLIPAATRCLLEAHQLIAGVVVIVEPGVVPLNSRGEKQRALLRDAFLADQLDPIYVSYNL